jgi:hypothetical protein
VRYDFTGNCFIADSMSDLDGWLILLEDDYKPGVKCCHITRVGEFRIVYVSVPSPTPSAPGKEEK